MTDLPLQGAAPSGFERAQPTVSEDARPPAQPGVLGRDFRRCGRRLGRSGSADDARRRDRIATLDPGTGDNRRFFSVVTGLVRGVRHPAAFAGGYIAARMSGKTAATTGASWSDHLGLHHAPRPLSAVDGRRQHCRRGVQRVANAVGGMGQTVAQAAGPIVSQSNPLEAIENQVCGNWL